MVWLNDISPWTLAAFGLSWLGVSGVCALALGKVLARGNDAAATEAQAVLRLESLGALKPAAETYREETGDWPHHEELAPDSFAEDAAYDFDADADDDEAYAGRAASGTQFKPVLLDEKNAPGEAERPHIRRVR